MSSLVLLQRHHDCGTGYISFYVGAAPVDDVGRSILGYRVQLGARARVDMGGLCAVLTSGHFDDDLDTAGNLLEQRGTGFTRPILSVQF